MLAYMSATTFYGIENGVNLLINPSEPFMYLRIGLIGALLLLFFTRVPRSIATRLFTGILAGALFIVNGYFMMSNSLMLLDGMMFALVAIILGIEALEFEPESDIQVLAKNHAE